MDVVLIILGILGFGAIIISAYIFTVAARNYVSEDQRKQNHHNGEPAPRAHVTRSPTERQQSRREELLRFVSLLQVVDWTSEAAEEYALIRSDLQAKGTPIGNMDLLIAAHAKSRNAVLVTNNLKEFNRVSGLTCENWVNPS